MGLALCFFLLVMMVAAWVGWNGLGRPKRVDSFLHEFPVVTLIGWYGLSLLLLLLGLIGWIRPLHLLVLLVLLLMGVWIDRRSWSTWLKSAFLNIQKLFIVKFKYRLFFFILFLFLFLLSRLPSFFIDVLYYHLGLPLHWLHQGFVQIVPDAPFSLVPFPTSLQVMWGLGLGLDAYPGILSLGQCFLAAFAIGVFLHRRFASPWGLVSILAFLTIPAVIEVVALHLNDAGVLWAGAVTGGLVYEWASGMQEAFRGWFEEVRTAIPGVIVLAMKPLVPVGAVLGALGLRLSSIRGKRYRWKVLSAWILALMLVLGPWVFLVTVKTGDPLAAARPYMVKSDLASRRWYVHLYLYTKSFTARARPLISDWIERIRTFIQPSDVMDDIAGWPGFFLLLLIPAVLLMGEGKIRLWFIGGWLGWYLTYRLQRYILFLYPAAILLVVGFLARRVRARAVMVFLMICFTLNVLWMTGRTTRALYIKRALWSLVPIQQLYVDSRTLLPASVPICRVANLMLDPKRHRLMFIGEYRYFPCRIPYLYISPFFRHPIERLAGCSQPEVCWDRLVTRERITHIIVTPRNIAPSYELSPRLRARLWRWLMMRGKILARAEGTLGPTYLIELRRGIGMEFDKKGQTGGARGNEAGVSPLPNPSLQATFQGR